MYKKCGPFLTSGQRFTYFILNVQLISSNLESYLFKAYCATLKKWCKSLKDQPQLLEKDGLCNYLKALKLADNVLSDSVFHFSVGGSLCLLVSLYRTYSLGVG